jgi:hypothetical protein
MARDGDGAQPPSPEEMVEAVSSESDIAVHWREEGYYPPP